MVIEKKTIIVDGFNLNIVFGHKKSEWIDKHKNHDEEDELWDFPIEELLNGAIEPNEDVWYWLINGRLYETFEMVEGIDIEDIYRYDVNMDGECVESYTKLDDAINHARNLYGKGYTDDVTIWDNKEDKEVEW